jgi:hypothetical protein
MANSHWDERSYLDYRDAIQRGLDHSAAGQAKSEVGKRPDGPRIVSIDEVDAGPGLSDGDVNGS